MTHSAASDPLILRLRRAATHVFGDSPLGAEVLQRCDDYEAERVRLMSARGGEQPVIALVGAAGQGKTWLARALLSDEAVREALPSGDRARERTRQVTWIGTRPPTDFDPSRERYLACTSECMQALGIAYLLVDTPGMSDVDASVAEAARLAVHQATAHLLVVRRDQLRAGEIDMLAIAGEGALVVPVVNVVRARDASLEEDTRRLIERIRLLAPTSQVLDPVFIEYSDLTEDPAARLAVGHQAAREVAMRLATHLRELAGGQRLQTRLTAARKRFRRDLAEQLATQLPELAAAERRLRDAAERLPGDVAESLIGTSASLRVAVRTRLRLAMLHDTSALWFPYRTLLGLLNLTHGAWDRLMLAMAGSLPSLVTTAWSSFGNLKQLSEMSSDKSLAVQQRAQSLVQDRLRPVLGSFRRELQRLRHGGEDRASRQEIASARLTGIDSLQNASQAIFEEQISKYAVSRGATRLLAFLGTLLFWAMLAGPIVWLYRVYGVTSLKVLSGEVVQHHDFPEPTAAMLFTSLLLSLLPTALYAMATLAWGQGTSRVNRCAEAVQRAHQSAIADLSGEGTLQLEFDDPLVEDARVLLSIGHQL